MTIEHTVTFDDLIPVLDILEDYLREGAYIKFDDEIWILYDKDGEGICNGETIRKMLVNLIWVAC